MTTPAANILVIMLHGVGSSGSDLAPLAGVWRDRLPGAVFASPNAPSPSSFSSGYQWFSVAGVTEENRPARISEARASFDETISAIIEENGFFGRLDRVALAGRGRRRLLWPACLAEAAETLRLDEGAARARQSRSGHSGS
jgi:phospholipase/carboxylesterase